MFPRWGSWWIGPSLRHAASTLRPSYNPDRFKLPASLGRSQNRERQLKGFASHPTQKAPPSPPSAGTSGMSGTVRSHRASVGIRETW